MLLDDFKRIMRCFLDDPSSLDVRGGEFVVQVRDELISAKIEKADGNIFVTENDLRVSAQSWLVERVAKLPQLSARILEYIPTTSSFVRPTGVVLRSLEDDPSSSGSKSGDILLSCRNMLADDVPGTTSVIYLTSDAGEGKTTIINQLALEVAERFKRREARWILLPIPLGGRAFLRFDELVVSTLVTKFRFPYWYYEGFIELVKLGVIVPAFDGFEEMIVEGASGEAVSALGNLMSMLGSEGRVLFAARKAFFEYQNFRTQAKLFDAIGQNNSVAFSRLSIDRWSKAQFVEYARARGVGDPEEIYSQFSSRFGERHPLITRAVLVRRIFDLAGSASEASVLLQRIGRSTANYFHEFVGAIIHREAGEKWLDKEGREGQSLLSPEEHLELLGAVAREMWLSSTDSLRYDVLEVVADLYCEERSKSPPFARQIRERLKSHALLVDMGSRKKAVSFDHDDFRGFFVGVSLGRLLLKSGREELRTFLRVAALSGDMIDEALLIFRRAGGRDGALLSLIVELGETELPTSFSVENIGSLVMRLLDGAVHEERVSIRRLTFPAQSLLGKTLLKVSFENCYFSPTGLQGGSLKEVVFRNCRFEQLDVREGMKFDASLLECQIVSVFDMNAETMLFSPSAIDSILRGIGFSAEREGISEVGEGRDGSSSFEMDDELVVAERAIRGYLRSTQINEDTFRMRLGDGASLFYAKVLPSLVRAGVLEKVSYRGSGNQSRYKLAIRMSAVQSAIAQANGRFENFLKVIGEGA